MVTTYITSFDIFSRVKNKLAAIYTSVTGTSYLDIFEHFKNLQKKLYPQEPELEPAPGKKFPEPELPQNRPVPKPSSQ